jgi:hypothetical protein
MRHSPSIAPTSPDDQDTYIVLNDFGDRLGRAWPEVDEDRANRESVIRELLEGQFSNPVRVVAFNTGEGWSRDASDEIANELIRRMDIEGDETPVFLEDFLDRHSGWSVQLPLPLRGA